MDCGRPYPIVGYQEGLWMDISVRQKRSWRPNNSNFTHGHIYKSLPAATRSLWTETAWKSTTETGTFLILDEALGSTLILVQTPCSVGQTVRLTLLWNSLLRNFPAANPTHSPRKSQNIIYIYIPCNPHFWSYILIISPTSEKSSPRSIVHVSVARHPTHLHLRLTPMMATVKGRSATRRTW